MESDELNIEVFDPEKFDDGQYFGKVGEYPPEQDSDIPKEEKVIIHLFTHSSRFGPGRWEGVGRIKTELTNVPMTHSTTNTALIVTVEDGYAVDVTPNTDAKKTLRNVSEE